MYFYGGRKSFRLTRPECAGTDACRNRRQAAIIYIRKFFRDAVPGYEQSKIIGLSHQIGVRETRRVYGEHRLTQGRVHEW